MKLVIQNGSSPPVSRCEMEEIIKAIPAELLKDINTVCLCHAEENDPKITFHEKSCSLYVHAESCSKNELIEELVICLGLLKLEGHIPRKASKAKREQCMNLYSEAVTLSQKAVCHAAT